MQEINNNLPFKVVNCKSTVEAQDILYIANIFAKNHLSGDKFKELRDAFCRYELLLGRGVIANHCKCTPMKY